MVRGNGATQKLLFHKTQHEEVLDQRGRVDYLLQLNRKHVLEYASPEVSAARQRYRSAHPTAIGAFKCMDGRVHLPTITQLPLGIIHSWRNIGGQFNLGWPFCGHDVHQWMERAAKQVHPCLLLVTYHFSRGDVCRGCAGFGYDTLAAIDHTRRLKEQIDRVFGQDGREIAAIQVGIETDTEAMVLHGENGETFDCGDRQNVTHTSVMQTLHRMYPEMPVQIVLDLIPLVLGNVEHTTKIRSAHRPIAQIEHREWVLGVGRGFEWFNLVNKALIVGPFSPNLDEPIMKAAGIIEENITANRIYGDGFVLLASAAYYDHSSASISLAEEESRYLHRFSVDAIERTRPQLLSKMIPLVAIVDMSTRALRVIKP